MGNLPGRKRRGAFSQCVRASPVAYQSLDEQGCFLDVNPVYCEMLGYRADELIGTSFGALWTPPTRAFFVQALDSLKRENHTHADLQLVCKEGVVIEDALNGSVQRNERGRFIRARCVFRMPARPSGIFLAWNLPRSVQSWKRSPSGLQPKIYSRF